MAIIKCTECGKEFSEFAKACPDCGMPTHKIIKERQLNIVQAEKPLQHIKPKEKVAWYKNPYGLKTLVSVVIFIVLNILLIDETSTVTFGTLILLNAAISFAVVFISLDFKWKNVKGALLMMPIYMFILTLFHTFIPTVDIVKSGNTHEKRYAIYFHAKTTTGDIQFLAPFKNYIYNETGRILYLTSVGYGKYKSEPNKHTVIPPNTIKKGNVNAYFTEPNNSVWVRSKGKVEGTWHNYLDYKKY